MQKVAASSTVNRFKALDIVRGLAIIGMVFSSMLPSTLPAWMFHARTPPPSMKFDPTIMGITWVDLVLPFFLFSLGAAIPFALKKRVVKNGVVMTIFNIITRFLLLAFFAVFLPQIDNLSWGNAGVTCTQILTIIGFAMMFGFFVRLPKESRFVKWQLIINIVGFAGVVLLLASKGLFDAKAFSWSKQNIILMILANTYLLTGLSWLFTRENIPMRFLVLIGLVALRFSSEHSGWVADGIQALNTTTHTTFLGDLINISLMQFSHIAIMGSIAGEYILCYLAGKTIENDGVVSGKDRAPWSNWRYWGSAFISLAYVVFTCYALFINRDMELFVCVLASVVLLTLLMHKPHTALEVLIRRFALTGWILILVGLLFGPANDGVHKDSPSTIGYLYCSAGLAFFAILLMAILTEKFKIEKGLRLLQANGQNPMIAYVIGRHLLWPILIMIPIGQSNLNESITNGLSSIFGMTAGLLLVAVLKTLAVMLSVAYFTKYRYYWRT